MMKTASGTRVTQFATRVIAFFLLAGGLLGMVGSVLAVYHRAQQQPILTGMSSLLSAVLFGCSLLTGIALWRRTDSGFKWAKLLFAMQVPVFGFGRVSYEFSTFFSLRLMAGNTTHLIGGNIGSSSNLNLLPQPVGSLVGINVVAVLILWYLIRASQVSSGDIYSHDLPVKEVVSV